MTYRFSVLGHRQRPGPTTNLSRGAPAPLFVPPAPTSEWLELGVPPGSLVLGHGAHTGNLNYVPPAILAEHMLVPGATGTGKSMFLFNCLMQHILMLDGVVRGATLLDPHGELTKILESYICAHDLHKVRPIRIIRPGEGQVFGLNLLPDIEGVDPAVIVDAVVGAVATVWHQDLNEMPRLRQALSAILYAIKTCNLTLLEAVDLMLLEDRTGLRRHVTDRIDHPVFRAYFEDLEALSLSKRKEEFESTGRRLSEFLKLDIIRLCFGVREKEKQVNVQQIMDNGEVVILDLSGPQLSDAGAALLGALMVNLYFLYARKRKIGSTPHYFFIDEANKILTEDAGLVLDQTRKFGLHLTICVQTLSQLRKRGEGFFGSIMTNTKTKVIFGGLEDDDATLLARNCWRGQFNLEESKKSFERYVVTGDELVWLESESESEGHAHSSGRSSSWGESRGTSESASDSWGRTTSEGTSENRSTTKPRRSGLAESDDRGSETSGEGESRSRSEAEGRTASTGRSESRSFSEGSTESDTESRQYTTGRAQAFRSRWEKLPTKEYSLDELIHKVSVSIANLPKGVCLAKVGNRRVVRIKTLRVKGRVVSEAHLARVRAEMAAMTPFVLTREEAEAEYRAFRAALEAELAKRPGEEEDDE